MKNAGVRLLVYDVLRGALIHVGMRLELEHKVEYVDQEKDHTDTATDFDNVGIRLAEMLIVEGGVESRLRVLLAIF